MQKEKITYDEAIRRMDEYYKKRRANIDEIRREDLSARLLRKLNEEYNIAKNFVDAVYGH
ncbi:MAG: hypothetical protein AB2L13_20975 [Spirochaetota bacterium]